MSNCQNDKMSKPFDHFHFHGSAGLVLKLILTLCLSDYYPQAIGAVINYRMITQGENGEVQHRRGAAKAFLVLRF